MWEHVFGMFLPGQWGYENLVPCEWAVESIPTRVVVYDISVLSNLCKESWEC